jgi:carotenoid cleavage dioxygenase-like enzyme
VPRTRPAAATTTRGRAGRSPVLWRWRIDPRSGAVREDSSTTERRRRASTELTGRRAGFAYAARFRRDVGLPLADG